MKEKIFKLFFEKTSDTKIQFFRYLFVGGFAAVVNIGSLNLFTEVFNIYFLYSNVMGFILGLLVNYVLSRFLIFSKEKTNKEFLEFVIYALIGIIGLGLDTLFMWIGTSLIGIYYMLTKIISTGIVFIWNFLARKILYVIINKKGEEK